MKKKWQTSEEKEEKLQTSETKTQKWKFKWQNETN